MRQYEREYDRALRSLSERTYTRRQALLLGAGATAAAAMNGHVYDWLQPEYDLSRGDAVRPNIEIDVRPIDRYFNLLTGQNTYGATDAPIDVWAETPGVELLSDGRLLLQPLDMKIINKRSPLQEYVDNPQINTMGYIRTNGDFAVETSLSVTSSAHVQLYGELPKVMDDNRYERARVDCEISSGILRVRRWNNSPLDPVTKEFALPAVSSDHVLRIEKVSDALRFYVDGYDIGGMDENGVFDDGTIWLGLNTMEEYATVSSMRFEEIGTGPQQSGFWRSGLMKVGPSSHDTLQGLVDARGIPLLMGSAVSLYPLMSDPQYAQLMLGGDYGILTIENAMKELYLMSMAGVWEPKHALSLLRIIKDHGIKIKGHTALYDKAMHKEIEQMPTETHADKMRVAKYIEDHIVKFGEEFGQYLDYCDVVTETVDGFGPKALEQIGPYLRRFGVNLPPAVHLRKNVFERALGGKEWIALAFKTAAQVMPDTKLGPNEFALDIDPWHRAAMVFDLMDYVESQGGRVDYIGSQTHVYFRISFALRSVYRTLINDARARGRRLHTAELDVSMVKGEVAQGRHYGMIQEEDIRSQGVVEASITWGSDDKNGSTGGRGPGDALPFDDQYRKKFARRQQEEAIRSTQIKR